MGLNEKFFKTSAADTPSFAPVVYSGNGANSVGGNQITNVGFEPDMIWIKARASAENHAMVDVLRNDLGNILYPNLTNAEQAGNYITGTSSGFNVNTDNLNASGTNNYIAWCWKAGGVAVLNEDGTLDSQVSANVDAGFSIVSYTGGSANQTVGHGLDETPQLIIVKNRDTTGNGWATQSPFSGGADYHMMLNLTQEAKNNVNWIWNDTEPTSSVFSIGENGITNTSGDKYIGYCFHSVSSYQKIGSYIGSGVSGKQVTGLGFDPSFVMIKKSSATGSWYMFDSVRKTGVYSDQLIANSSAAEGTGTYVEFITDGFQLDTSASDLNTGSQTFIYLAIA